MTVPAFLHPFAQPARPRDEFITLVSGQGAVVYDDEGNAYIDSMASLWYVNVGYGHPDMVTAISEQAATLAAFHTFEKYTNEPAEALAERIARLAPMLNSRVFFTSSGSEAVDSAIKLARIAHNRAGAPERTIVISRDRAYHGVTYGGMSAQGLPMNQEGFGPLVPAILNVDADDLGKVEGVFEQYPNEVAAVITEPVQGAGGVFPPPAGYLDGLRALCDEYGAFLIFDEVITGFGRIGEWFAAIFYGVTPDMITFAKGITSGYVPLGGVIVGRKVLDPLEADPEFTLRHGHTYSGHPLAAAAGLANLDIMERENLLSRSAEIEAVLGGGLRRLVDEGQLAGVRGIGGVWAAQAHENQDEFAVRDRMAGLGVMARPLLGNLIYCPPLVITNDQLGVLVEVLETALS